MSPTAQLFGFLDLALAALLSGAIGFERERLRKPAGLRTHVLVGVAVALFVLVGRHLLATAEGNTQPDSMKMLEAIATGVSFLGAGTIIFRRSAGVVEGLTTAASLLLVAAIAMAAVLELRVLAVAVTAFALLVLGGLRAFEERMPHAVDAPAPDDAVPTGGPRPTTAAT